MLSALSRLSAPGLAPMAALRPVALAIAPRAAYSKSSKDPSPKTPVDVVYEGQAPLRLRRSHIIHKDFRILDDKTMRRIIKTQNLEPEPLQNDSFFFTEMDQKEVLIPERVPSLSIHRSSSIYPALDALLNNRLVDEKRRRKAQESKKLAKSNSSHRRRGNSNDGNTTSEAFIPLEPGVYTQGEYSSMGGTGLGFGSKALENGDFESWRERRFITQRTADRARQIATKQVLAKYGLTEAALELPAGAGPAAAVHVNKLQREIAAVARPMYTWNPKRKLSRSDMYSLRALHNQDPGQYNVMNLSLIYGISVEAVRRILRSRFERRVDLNRYHNTIVRENVDEDRLDAHLAEENRHLLAANELSRRLEMDPRFSHADQPSDDEQEGTPEQVVSVLHDLRSSLTDLEHTHRLSYTSPTIRSIQTSPGEFIAFPKDYHPDQYPERRFGCVVGPANLTPPRPGIEDSGLSSESRALPHPLLRANRRRSQLYSKQGEALPMAQWPIGVRVPRRRPGVDAPAPEDGQPAAPKNAQPAAPLETSHASWRQSETGRQSRPKQRHRPSSHYRPRGNAKTPDRK